MKKIIYLIIGLLFITGCEKSKELDFNRINKELSNTDLFTNTKSIDIEFIENKYGLDSEGIIDYTIYMSDSLKSASMYAIFKVEDDSAIEKIEKMFIDKYVFSWTNVVYDAKEAYLVNNMYKEKYGDYAIYIISEDNDKALKIIKD